MIGRHSELQLDASHLQEIMFSSPEETPRLVLYFVGLAQGLVVRVYLDRALDDCWLRVARASSGRKLRNQQMSFQLTQACTVNCVWAQESTSYRSWLALDVLRRR